MRVWVFSISGGMGVRVLFISGYGIRKKQVIRSIAKNSSILQFPVITGDLLLSHSTAQAHVTGRGGDLHHIPQSSRPFLWSGTIAQKHKYV